MIVFIINLLAIVLGTLLHWGRSIVWPLITKVGRGILRTRSKQRMFSRSPRCRRIHADIVLTDISGISLLIVHH